MKNGIYRPTSSYSPNGTACLRMYNINEGNIVWRDIKRMRLTAREADEYGLLPGDLLVNRVNSRELVGKSAVIPAGLEQCVFESKNIRVRLRRDLVVPEFVSYRLLAAGTPYFTQNAQQVVGMASISQPQIARFPVPLPSLAEQREVVAEIEKQFTRLDAGVAALRRVQANLKRYRAAILKAACEGRLVPTEAQLARRDGRAYEAGDGLLASLLEQRRERWTGRGDYREPASSVAADLAALPEGWVWARLEQLGFTVGGLTKNPKRAKLERRLPYLRVANVYANQLRLDEVERIGVDDAELPKLRLQTGDLLVVEGNGSKEQIGRVAMWDGSIDPCVHQNHLIRFRPVLPVLSKWLLFWLLSPQGRQIIESVASSAAGLYTLSVNKVSDLAVAIPPIAEQLRIVAEIERQVSTTDQLQAAVSSSLARAKRLRQSVLHAAFSGSLATSNS